MSITDATPDHQAATSGPLGHFHAISCRDGASLERDGEPYFDINRPKSSSGREVYEVMFADGAWLLASRQDLSKVRLRLVR